MRSVLMAIAMTVVACGGGEEAGPDGGGACPDESELQPAPVDRCYASVWFFNDCNDRRELLLDMPQNWMGSYGFPNVCREADGSRRCEWSPCIRFE